MRIHPIEDVPFSTSISWHIIVLWFALIGYSNIKNSLLSNNYLRDSTSGCKYSSTRKKFLLCSWSETKLNSYSDFDVIAIWKNKKHNWKFFGYLKPVWNEKRYAFDIFRVMSFQISDFWNEFFQFALPRGRTFFLDLLSKIRNKNILTTFPIIQILRICTYNWSLS